MMLYLDLGLPVALTQRSAGHSVARSSDPLTITQFRKLRWPSQSRINTYHRRQHPPPPSSFPGNQPKHRRYWAHIIRMPATTAETLSLVTRNVSVAPLVLLSDADHYGRQAKGTKRRVVGVLLGQNDGKNVRVSNSFAGR